MAVKFIVKIAWHTKVYGAAFSTTPSRPKHPSTGYLWFRVLQAARDRMVQGDYSSPDCAVRNPTKETYIVKPYLAADDA